MMTLRDVRLTMMAVMAIGVPGCTLDFDTLFERGAGGSSVLIGGAGGMGASGSGGSQLVGDILRFGEHEDAEVKGTVADTYVEFDDASDNHGTSGSLNIDGDQSVGLMRFDVSVLPGAATGAELSIRVDKSSTDDRIDLFEVTEPWNEGTASGDLGTCNWFNRTEADTWTAPGVGPGSRTNEPVASFTPSQSRQRYTIPLPPDLINRWVDDPDQNFGLVFVGVPVDPEDPDGVALQSSNTGSESQRPVLSVAYE